jgi:hypothetical protein
VASADRSETPGDAVTRRSLRLTLALSSLPPQDSACLLSLLILPGRFSQSVSTAWRRL